MATKQHTKEHIAFEGSKFTIEWYYDQTGRSIALDYFEALNIKDDYGMRIKQGDYYE